MNLTIESQSIESAVRVGISDRRDTFSRELCRTYHRFDRAANLLDRHVTHNEDEVDPWHHGTLEIPAEQPCAGTRNEECPQSSPQVEYTNEEEQSCTDTIEILQDWPVVG